MSRILYAWELGGGGGHLNDLKIIGGALRSRGHEVCFALKDLAPAMLAEANDSDGRWSMIVRGDPTLALRAGEATHYWSGTMAIPLELANRKNPAPVRDWWVEPADNPPPVIESGS